MHRLKIHHLQVHQELLVASPGELQLANLFHWLQMHWKVLLQVATPPELQLANLFPSHHQTVQAVGEEGEQHGSLELVGPLQVIVHIGEGTADTDYLLVDYKHLDGLLLDYKHLDGLQKRADYLLLDYKHLDGLQNRP
jgi:hypothetical protein